MCQLSGEVVDGALALVSTSVSARVGSVRIRVPRALAPVVTLIERFDDGSGLQHVTMTLDAPFVGRLYEYSGSFSYRIGTQS